MVVRKVLIAPHQNLVAGIGVGGITPDTETDSGETGKRKSRGRHCWYGFGYWLKVSEQGSDTVSATPVQIPYVYLSRFTIRRCSIVSDTLRYSPHFSAPDFSYLVDTSDPLGLSFGLR